MLRVRPGIQGEGQVSINSDLSLRAVNMDTKPCHSTIRLIGTSEAINSHTAMRVLGISAYDIVVMINAIRTPPRIDVAIATKSFKKMIKCLNENK